MMTVSCLKVNIGRSVLGSALFWVLVEVRQKQNVY
mgnify:CR=1 FL=1